MIAAVKALVGEALGLVSVSVRAAVARAGDDSHPPLVGGRAVVGHASVNGPGCCHPRPSFPYSLSIIGRANRSGSAAVGAIRADAGVVAPA